MHDEINILLREVLLDKFALDLTEDEIWLIEEYDVLLCHIVKDTPLEFEWRFREYQGGYGKNLATATVKFTVKDTPITPVFTGKWKLV